MILAVKTLLPVLAKHSSRLGDVLDAWPTSPTGHDDQTGDVVETPS
jgi:hypothetical protein